MSRRIKDRSQTGLIQGSHDFMESQDIVIVGGGIAGLATALALHRAGLKSIVLEQADSLRVTGSCLNLWDNGWRALHVLGVADALREKHTELQRIETFSVSLGLKKALRLKGDDERDHEVRSVKRKELLKALAAELPPQTIRFGSKISAIRKRANPPETLVELADTTQISTKVLIGCDGVHSVVAEWLGLGTLNLAGRSTFLGLANIPEGHQFEPKVLQIWGNGMRAGFAPCNEKEVFWFVTRKSLPEDAEISHDPERMRQEALDELVDFPQKTILDLVKKTQAGTLSLAVLKYRFLWPFMAKRAWNGTVTVAGDAMHPMTPDMGQGGGMALEDAVVLGRCLGEAMIKGQNGTSDDEVDQCIRIEMALKKYVEERKWRVFGFTVGSYISGILQGNLGKAGAGGWIFIPKEGMIILYAQGYQCEMNNSAEYEGLLNGLRLARDRGIRSLVVHHIPRGSNSVVDMMTNLGACLDSHALISITLSTVEMWDRKRVRSKLTRWLATEGSPVSFWSSKVEMDHPGIPEAKEMAKATEEIIQGLREAVQTLQKGIRLLKDVVQGIFTTSLHIMHDMAHLRCRLGHCTNRVTKEPTCASSIPAGKQKSEDATSDFS
eukprot:Gb_22081 [translate_table: standard]